jgi:hypothetical protein
MEQLIKLQKQKLEDLQKTQEELNTKLAKMDTIESLLQQLLSEKK